MSTRGIKKALNNNGDFNPEDDTTNLDSVRQTLLQQLKGRTK